MTRARTLLILGIWTAILPQLGFPLFFKNILFALTGIGIIYLSFVLYKENKKENGEDKSFDSFSENKDFNNNLEN